MAKASRTTAPIPDPVPYVRDEAVHIPTGDTRFTVDLDVATVEALERGICPEDLSQRMHDLLRWRRDAIRATTKDRSYDDGRCD